MKTRFLRHCLYAVVAGRLLPNIQSCERLRARLARRLLGAEIGLGVMLNAHADFGADARAITIGEGSYINRRCTFSVDGGAPITLGRNVQLGPETMLWTGSHHIGPPAARGGPLLARPITIGDGCRLGARVTVLGGVEIGAGCVIAAGALVSKDVPPNELWGGVPARFIRKLEE